MTFYTETELLDLARQLTPVCEEAGLIEIAIRDKGLDVIQKDNNTPVTLADQEAEICITEHLTALAPHIPIVGEEAAAAGQIPDISGGTFFCVDALDGTRAFIKGSENFTVNIGLLHNNRPVMGIIYAPVTGALYFGTNTQSFKLDANGKEQRIQARTPSNGEMNVIAGQVSKGIARIEKFIHEKSWTIKNISHISSSIKFCLIAEGLADIYPRLGGTSEWDTAAGDAILRGAGGVLQTLDGKDLTYGKAEQDKPFENPHFMALGQQEQ